MGSFIPHSNDPSVKVVPFLYAPNHKLDDKVVSYSLLWPVKHLHEGDLVTRDFLNGIPEEKQRSHRLSAWFKPSTELYQSAIDSYNKVMTDRSMQAINIISEFYKVNGIKQREVAAKIGTYPEMLNVITDYEFIQKYLKNERFRLVEDLNKADIVWLVSAADEEDWKRYKDKYIFNQFPYESCVVIKHNLANTVQSVLGDTSFLMRTYDLEQELAVFIGDYQQRQREGKDNLWILKPPNMARSMDMIITDQLPLIIRAMETGPKLAQKYIEKPVLRRGMKVDFRYMVLVKSVVPLTVYLYKHFWPRSANVPYTTDRRTLANY